MSLSLVHTFIYTKNTFLHTKGIKMNEAIQKESYNMVKTIPASHTLMIADIILSAMNKVTKIEDLKVEGIFDEHLLKIKGQATGVTVLELFDLAAAYVPEEELARDICRYVYEMHAERISYESGLFLDMGVLTAKLYLDVYKECMRKHGKNPIQFVMELVMKTHTWFEFYCRYNVKCNPSLIKSVFCSKDENKVAMDYNLVKNYRLFSELLEMLYGKQPHPKIKISWMEVLLCMNPDDALEGDFKVFDKTREFNQNVYKLEGMKLRIEFKKYLRGQGVFL